MALPRLTRFRGRVATALVTATWLTSCGGGSSPSPPPPSADPVPDGATRVTGSERLAWNQPGDVSGLRFVAYVDGGQVRLDAASCDGGSDAECSSPLPPLTDGVHTLALGAISLASGLEGGRSNAITVQKVSARSVVSAASYPDAVSPSSAGLESIVTAPDGRAFAVDVVARGLIGTVQLAATPDGRVLVADAANRVRIMRPGEPVRLEPALDVRGLLGVSAIGRPGIAAHPEFARNQFVYVAMVTMDPSESPRLRVVRLREAGETLGEPAALFEAPLRVETTVARVAEGLPPADAPSTGPWIAFGPDDLLYVLLPPGMQLADLAAASRPHASMLRLTDEGRVPDAGPLTAVSSHPLGFAWHPGTSALLGLVDGREGDAMVRDLSNRTPGAFERAPVSLRMSGKSSSSSAALVFDSSPLPGWALSLAQGLDQTTRAAIRLSVPVRLDGLLVGISGRLTDAVVQDGVWHLAVLDDGPSDAGGGEPSSSIVRLRPR